MEQSLQKRIARRDIWTASARAARSFVTAAALQNLEGIAPISIAPERPFTRRSFLGMSLFASALIAGYDIQSRIRSFLRNGAARDLENRRNNAAPNEIYNGFLEAELRALAAGSDKELPEFFTLKGHLQWLKAMTAHPIIQGTGATMIRRMDRTSVPPHLTKAGDTLRNFINEAGSRLHARAPHTNPELLRSEAVHAGILAAAAVMNNTIDVEDFGFDHSSWGEDTQSAQWGVNGFSRNSFPALFPGPRTAAGNEAYGKDRAMHFFNHMALTYEMLYSGKYQLPESYEMPMMLGKSLEILRGTIGDQRPFMGNTATGWFVNISGLAYEATALKHKWNWSQTVRSFIFGDTSDYIPDSGPFDPEVGHDLTANYLGEMCGIALFNGHVNEVIDILNDQRLLELTTTPTIPTALHSQLIELM